MILLRDVSREEFFDAYCRLVNRLKELYPKAEIYLLTYYAPPGIGEEWSQMMNEEIRRTADACGVKFWIPEAAGSMRIPLSIWLIWMKRQERPCTPTVRARE